MLITLELDGIFGSNFVYLYILTLSRISIGSTYTLEDVKPQKMKFIIFTNFLCIHFIEIWQQNLSICQQNMF